MKYTVKLYVENYRTKWVPGRHAPIFGQHNEGVIIDADSEEHAVQAFNNSLLPGQRINPFYLMVTKGN